MDNDAEDNPVRYVCDYCDTLEEHYGSEWFEGNVLKDDWPER